MAAIELAERLRAVIRDVPDFPREGVLFKDVTTLLGDATAFRAAIEGLAEAHAGQSVDLVVGVESRGFILGGAVAYLLGAGFVPVRKPGKLPWDTHAHSYELEYGSDVLEVHRDALTPNDQVLIVDDVLATGGTASATVRLAERLGATVLGLGFVIELAFLHGRDKLQDRDLVSLLVYE